jgi:glycerol-3-phosphate acyltransferase PlsX
MRPGIGRIRRTFDYEVLGGSPLLGVRGTVIITHGRAKRRMIKYAVGVGAASARARLPELIGEAFRSADSPATDDVAPGASQPASEEAP